MFLRIFIFFFLFFNYFLNSYANDKQLIVNKLLEIDNFTFSFEQITQGKVETGTCLLVFDNKLKCNYVDEKQKEIIINNKTLVIMNKKYDKIYFYPISKSPFLKILSKSSLINMIKKSSLELNDNIDLIYINENNKKITIFFEKKKYNLVGWKTEDKFQNEINFLLKIQDINTEIEDGIFKIPSIN